MHQHERSRRPRNRRRSSRNRHRTPTTERQKQIAMRISHCDHGPACPIHSESIPERLEYLRSQIDAEQISYGELLELQGGLADQIEPGDVQLLEWAGVEEFAAHESCGSCGAHLEPSTEFPWHLPDEDCRAIRKPTES